MRTPLVLSSIALLAFLAACGSSAPAHDPHSMSTAEHDKSAAAEESSAKAHEAKYDPAAAKVSERCGRLPEGVACWSSVENPTEAHLKMADDHRKAAEAHRKGSASLRDAEVKSCVGVADDDRDSSPFHHAEDIVRVDVLGGTGKPETGVIVVFRAVPGMTEGGLQKVLDCHLARNAALGHQVPEMTSCPLVPKGARAKVAKTSDGFAVTIDADTADAQKDIVTRGKSLRK